MKNDKAINLKHALSGWKRPHNKNVDYLILPHAYYFSAALQHFVVCFEAKRRAPGAQVEGQTQREVYFYKS